MSDKKTIKRAVKAIWDGVKLLRKERGDLQSPSDMVSSADRLAQFAQELRARAQELSALSAMPSEPTHKAKTKRKPPADLDSK